MRKDNPFGTTAVVSFLVLVTLGMLYLASLLYSNSVKDKNNKADYFTVNQIKYGLLSGDNWSAQVNRIIAQQVDSFTFSEENKKILTVEISNVLERLFNEVEVVLHKK